MRDQFDRICDSKVSIWKKGASGVVDTYGIVAQLYTLLIADVACRFDPGAGKEIVSDAGFGTQDYTFFMRPIKVDEPPVDLNIHHWLQINVARGVQVSDPSSNGTMFDITNIKNASGHHLEISALLIEP